MSQSLIILGRQPALGLAELESLLGPEVMQPVGDSAVIIDKHHSDVPFSRLGGSVKLTKLLHEFPSTDWKAIENYLIENLPKHLEETGDSKLTIGLSVFRLGVSIKQLLAAGLKIKKTLKSHEKSVRLVPNKTPALNSAQVIHNKLTTKNGWELIFVRHDKKVLMGLTTQEQDIEAYTARDQQRPMRDAKVGMLPPKLAQIIINLAVGDEKFQKNTTIDGWEETYALPFHILDPFCGTGVILQEAMLMGYSVIGSDLDGRMVGYSTNNLQWLTKKYPLDEPIWEVYLNYDATAAEWRDFQHIATETYLGRPFSHQPDPETLKKVMQDVDTIHQKFLANVARQTKPGFRMCVAVPAWHTKSGVKHLKTLESLEKLGYNRLSFGYADDKDLIYHREGQIVGRELVVLERK